MMENSPVNNLQREPGKKFFTAQARRVHVRAYQSSGESMIAYCDKHHLALSTFKTWVTKYSEKSVLAAFVPVTMLPKNPDKGISKTKASQRVEIHTGDIKIIFQEISDIETLIQFIRGLSHANPVKSTGNFVL